MVQTITISNGLTDVLEISGVEKELHQIYVGRCALLSMLAGASLTNLTSEQQWAFDQLKKQYPELDNFSWTVFPHCYFIGQTYSIEERIRNWDYGKLMGGPPSLDFAITATIDLRDKHLHKIIVKQSDGNWFISPFKGSDEILCSFTEGYKELCERVNYHSLEQQPFLENFKRKTGVSYPQAKKLASSNKDTYWCRYIFNNEVLEKIADSLKDFSKDTLIHVDQDFYGNISEFLLSKGFSNVVTDINETCKNIDNRVKLKTKQQIDDMNPTVNIGNPPYQAPNTTEKRGKGGNNSLYIKFIEDSVDRAPDGGIVVKICPPSALTKSTILNQPSSTLKKMLRGGSLDEIDFTVDNYFDVGTFICSFKWTKGKKQGKVKLTTADGVEMVDVEDLYHLPPIFTKLERDLFKKITTNKDGEYLNVVRGKKNQECTMERFGYPKVQIGGNGVLGFDMKFYNFMSSQLGLWLLDYIRRHDQMIYHNVLTGIHVPEGGFKLTEDEQNFIDNGSWINFSRKE